MKRIALVALFLSSLGITSPASSTQCSFDSIISNLPHQLPYDDGANIWTDVTIFNPDCGSSVYLIYSKSGSIMEFSAFGSGFPSTLKSQWSNALWYLSTNSGNSWINYGVGSSFASGNDEWGVGSKYPYHEWKSTQNLYFNYSGGMNFYWNGVTYWHLGQTSHGQKILNASSFAGGGLSLLTINQNPYAGGMVTSSPAGIDCGADCQENLSGDVTLTATPSENWAFGFWDDGITSYTENPKTFTIDQNKTITAKFFKTFRASAGSFYANIGDTGEECVPYVRSETGIPWADFNGDAYTTYQQAINAGYKVSNSVPRVSSVIVFAAQGGITVGHVAIVTAINGNNLTMRDSNWGLDGKVSEHTVDVTNYTILGYIYPMP